MGDKSRERCGATLNWLLDASEDLQLISLVEQHVSLLLDMPILL